MRVRISSLRAAGLSSDQILVALEHEENERIAARREQNRIAKQNQRSRQQNIADCADTPPPSCPPSSLPPITPILTTPPSTPSPDSRTIARAIRPTINLDFERFWLAYPKRKGANPKHPARLKFEGACRAGVSPGTLIAGAKAYADHELSGTEFIAQAVTWLHQRRWEDYGPAPPKFTPEELERGREWYARKKREQEQ
jgi:hypothetical protein